MKIRKATPAEKAAYNRQDPRPTYPLSHFATLDDGNVVPIEWLGGEWEKEDPQYEAVAPAGYWLDVGEIMHTLLGVNFADMRDRLKGVTLQPCDDDCTCKDAPECA